MTGHEKQSDPTTSAGPKAHQDAETLKGLRWEAAYWQLMAIEKRRAWFYKAGRRSGWLPGIGGDEYGRLTLVVGTPITGHLVIALWREKTPDLKADLAELQRIVEND